MQSVVVIYKMDETLMRILHRGDGHLQVPPIVMHRQFPSLTRLWYLYCLE